MWQYPNFFASSITTTYVILFFCQYMCAFCSTVSHCRCMLCSRISFQLPFMCHFAYSYLVLDLLKKVKSFGHYLQCVKCPWKCHVKCMGVSVHDITQPKQWYCPPCMQFVLPYNHFDDNDSFRNAVIEGMLDCSFHYHESDTPFTEIDLDFHFYTDRYCIKIQSVTIT